LFSCATSKLSQTEIEGTFVQRDNRRIELHLDSKTFVLKDNFEPTHLAIENYKCCDTIAYGKWLMDNNFLVLSSPEELSTFYLNVNVVEEFQENKDSIAFVIQNPIEKYSKQDEKEPNELYYKINVMTNDGNTISKVGNTNTIKIKKVEGISMVEIEVYPNYNIDIRDISARVVYTMPYQAKNPKANIFKIDIPELSYSYLAYKRLNQDYIKIVNKSTLLWNGLEYVKL